MDCRRGRAGFRGVLNFGDQGRAYDGGVGEAPKNGNVPGLRNTETDGDGKLRDHTGSAQERREIERERVFCAGDTGAGDEIEKPGRTSGNFR
jgi:hypothetical protein